MIKRSHVKALVIAAVKLAIIRHDLATDDAPIIVDSDADVIAQDVWDALNGLGTCSGEVAPELQCLLGTV